MASRVIDAVSVANRIVQQYLRVRPREEVVIVADPETDMRMVHALAGSVASCGAEYTIAIMPTRRQEAGSTDVTRFIDTGLEAADVLIGITRASGAPVYNARLGTLLKEKRIRSCSMVMRDLDNWVKGGALADYEQVYREGQNLAAIWSAKKSIRLTSEAGTDLVADIGDGRVIIECGIAREPGCTMAFSDGEVSQMPNEGTANGTVVIDGPICYLGLPSSPVTLTVKNGRVTGISGGSRTARELERLLDEVPNSDNFAEIGIGLNPKSLRNGDFEEEKKARGNVHVAIGDNTAYGGTVKSSVHMDMVIYRPTVVMDGHRIVDSGTVLLELA